MKLTALKDFTGWTGFQVVASNSVLKTLDGYGGFAMWIKNTDTDNSITMHIAQQNSVKNLDQISGTYYLISSKGVITTKSGKEPVIPANFEGWLVLPKEKFVKYGLWDSSILKYYYFNFYKDMKSGNVVYFDSIGFYRDLEQFKADVTKPDLGDVNADYSINSEDLTSLRRHLLDNDEEVTAKYPDVNIDTYIDILDLVALKKSIAKVS